MRMLIIDDSLTMRRYLAHIADELEIEAEQAADGQEAMASLEQRSAGAPPFDVALVDWDMPRMNGVEFVRAVRRRPEYDAMKLMMVTSHNALNDVRNAIVAGVDDYLMKPLDAEMLSEKLRLLGLIE
jgi:two-component system, chemotaxis family, chemotaxis protein CheY